MIELLKNKLYKYKRIIGIFIIIVGIYGLFKGITGLDFKETILFIFITYIGNKVRNYDIHSRKTDSFLYKHSHLLGGCLMFISFFGFLFSFLDLELVPSIIFGIAFYLGILSWKYSKKIDVEIKEQINEYNIQKNNYINSIKPENTIKQMCVNIYHDDLLNYLGIMNTDGLYMFVTNAKYIFFPETTVKDQPFYLTKIDFNPQYDSKFEGYSDGISEFDNYYNESYRYGYGYNMGSMSGRTTQIERSSYALLTFVTPDLSNSFTMKFLNMKKDNVNYLNQYFKLNQIELKKIGL